MGGASVLHSFRRAVQSNPTGLACISFSRARGSSTFITYAELEEEVYNVASSLLRSTQGLQHKGDRLAMICRNHDTALVYLYVASLLGLTLVPLNFRWTPREVAHGVKDSGAKVVVVDKDITPLLAEVPQGALEAVVVLFHDSPSPLPGLPPGVATILHDNMIHRDRPPRDPACLSEGRETSSDDLHCLLYTSGTTGAPKAVMITHLNQVVQALEKCAVVGYSPTTVYLNLAPLFHIGGLNSTLAVSMGGGTHVFLEEGLQVEAALEAIRLFEVNTLVVVPAILHALLTSTPHPQPPLPSVTTVLVGGQMMPPRLHSRAQAAFPSARFIQTYACSEACSSISFLPLPANALPAAPTGGEEGDGSGPSTSTTGASIGGGGAAAVAVGKAAHHCEVVILNEVSGRPLPPGEVGEIATRGPHVMAGYWGKPHQTEQALRGGWLHTGDLGYLDSHGILHLVGRLQEVIRTGGESVHPSQVERVLEEHPRVAQAAVFGLPDEKFGEKVTAAVVLRADDQTAAGGKEEADKAKGEVEREILEHCHRRLSRYKCPKQVIIMASLPKNGSGKVVKAQLRSSL